MPSVVLPAALSPDSGGRRRLELPASATSVSLALEAVFALHPRLRLRILTEQGELRPNVNVFVDGENVRFEEGLGTAVPESAEVVVLPAISGG